MIIFNYPNFKIHPQIDSEQEKTRRKYEPRNVRYLLVGESMPDGGTFFYKKNSNLYSYTEQVFLQNFDWSKKDFLTLFKSNGFYLDDLCQEPINQLTESVKRKARKAYEHNFSDRIKEYQPLIIISLLKTIKNNIQNAIFLSGLNIKHIAINSPFFGGQYKYMIELDKVIKENIKPLFLKSTKKQNE